MDSIILSVGVNAKNIERDIIAGARAAEKALHFTPKIDPTGLNKLSGPLGRLNSQASEFNKSLEASNARVIAFGASAGAIFAVQKGFTELLKSAIEVEKVFADINSVLGASSQSLNNYKKQVFDIAKNTGSSFQVASEAFLELSRQGLSAEASAKRLNAALILARLGGLDAKDAVEGLTAAINSFNKEALDDVEVVNKLANVSAKFAVSEKDLTEAIKRSASAASDAGVNFDELTALVTAAQQTTARGGAVIGNALKTIFTRLQRSDTLDQLEELGVATKTASGSLLNAQDILKNLAGVYKDLGQQQQAFVSELVGGVFQINQLKAQLSDLGKEYGVYEKALNTSTNATNEALMRNEELNKTVSASINAIGVSFVELADQLGSDIFFPVFRNLENATSDIVKVLGAKGEEGGISFGEGIAKGLGGILSGPGLLVGGAVVLALFSKLAFFAADAGKSIIQTITGVEKQRQVQAEIQNILALSGKSYQDIIRGASSLEEVEKRILAIVRQQVALRESSASITAGISPMIGQRLTGGKIGKAGLKFKDGQFQTTSLPNYADPLKSAISREIAAGVNPKDIYIDSDPRVKSSSNPMGLLVANKRDEPMGGFQGVNRATRMGIDPKKHGMSGGYVPNFAEFDKLQRPVTGRPQFKRTIFGEDIEQFSPIDPSDAKKLRSIFSELRMGGGRLRVNFEDLVAEIGPYIETLGLSEDSLSKLNNKIGKIASNLPINIALSKVVNPETPESRAQWIENDKIRAEREAEYNKTVRGGARKTQKYYDELGDLWHGKNSFTGNPLPPFPGSTYAEKGTGRDLFNLSYQSLGMLGQKNVTSQRGKVDVARAIRSQLDSYRTTNLSKDGRTNDTGREFIDIVGRLASQDTLQEKFKASVKKSIESGMDFNAAVTRASNDFVAAGGSSKQLRDAVVKNAKSFTDLEKNLQIEKTKRQETITDIAKRNDAEMALAKSNGELAALTKEQQVVIRARIREEAKAALGLSGVTDEELRSNPMALRQVQALESNPMRTRVDQLRKIAEREGVMGRVQQSIESGKDLSPGLKKAFNRQIEQSVLASAEFEGFSKDQIKTNPVAKRLFDKRVKQGQEAYMNQITSVKFDTALNTAFSQRSTLFGRKSGDLAAVQKAFGNKKLTPEQMLAFETRQQQVQQARSGRFTGIGIGASFLASGIASSGILGEGRLAGGAQGAATGASMGAFFGAPGLIAGAGIGAIAGTVMAASEEAGKAFQKTAEAYKSLTEELNNNKQSVQGYTSAQEQLNSMIASGTAKESDINNLNKQMSELFNSITDNDLRSNILAAAGDMDKLAKAFEDYSEVAGKKEAVERVGVLTASALANRGGFFSGKKFKSDDLDNIGKSLALSANLSESKIKELNGALSDLAKNGNTSELSAALKEFGFDFEKFGASFSEGLQVLSVAIGEGGLAKGSEKARASTAEYTKAVAALNAEIKKSSDRLIKAKELQREINSMKDESKLADSELFMNFLSGGETEMSLFKNQSSIAKAKLGLDQKREREDLAFSQEKEVRDFVMSNVTDPQKLNEIKSMLDNKESSKNIESILEKTMKLDEKSFKDGKASLKALEEMKYNFGIGSERLNAVQSNQTSNLDRQNILAEDMIRRRDLANSFGGSAKFGQAVDTSIIRAGFAAGAATTFNNKTLEKSGRYDLSQVNGRQLRDRDEYNGRYSPDAVKAQITEAQGIIDAGRMFPELIKAVRTPEAMSKVEKGVEAQLTQNNKDVLLGSLKGFFEGEQGKNGAFSLPNGDVSADGVALRKNIAIALKESRGGTDFTKLKEVVTNSGLQNRSPEAYERLMRIVNTADQFSGQISEAAKEQAKELLKTDKERRDDVVQSYIDGLNRSDMTSSLKEIEGYMAKLLTLSMGGKEVVAAQLGAEAMGRDVNKAKEAEAAARNMAADLKKSTKIKTGLGLEVDKTTGQILPTEIAKQALNKNGMKKDFTDSSIQSTLGIISQGGSISEISKKIMESEDGKRFASRLAPTAANSTERLEKLNQFIAEFASGDTATKLDELTKQYKQQSVIVDNLNSKMKDSQDFLVEQQQIYGRLININNPAIGGTNKLRDVSREVVAAMFGAQTDIQKSETAIKLGSYTDREIPIVRKKAQEAAAQKVSMAIDKEGSLAAARAFSETFLKAIKEASPEVAANVQQEINTKFNLVLQDSRITKEEFDELQKGFDELAKKVFKLNNENRNNNGENTNPPSSNPNSSGSSR